MKTIIYSLSVGVLLCSQLVNAKDARTKWYRVYKNNVPHISQSISKEHIRLGYEELDASFRLLVKHEPYDEVAVKQQKQEQEELKKSQQTKKQVRDSLFKRYDSSSRAVRKRIDLLNDINTKRHFAESEVKTTEAEYKKYLDKAATFEKSGKPITDELKKVIADSKRKLDVSKGAYVDTVQNYYAQLETLNEDIRKLRKYEITDAQ